MPVLAQLVHAAGAHYLEAPVSGSKGPAEQGTLIFLAGGDEELFERSGPMLDVMGKAKFFLGPVRAHFFSEEHRKCQIQLPICSYTHDIAGHRTFSKTSDRTCTSQMKILHPPRFVRVHHQP